MGILMRNGINYSGSQLPSVTIEDSGKILTVNNNGAWSAQEVSTDEQVSEAVDEWLTNHPEATTTVQDNSLTWVKFNDVLKNMMFNLGITDSKSGEVVSTSDAAEFPLKDLQSEITATQNLNGYDYPWVGGAGKNKLKPLVRTGTTNGISYSINADGSVTLNGTATTVAFVNIDWRDDSLHPFDVTPYIGKTLYASMTPSLIDDGRGNFDVTVYIENGYRTCASKVDNGKTFTYEEGDLWGRSYILISSGATFNNETFYPLVCLNSETNKSWTPYENICPISGRTEVNVTRTGVNVWDEEWEVGDINRTTGENAYASTQIRSKNYIPVFPNTGYYIHVTKSGGSDVAILYYDRNKGFLSAQWGSNLVRTTPNNCYYIRFTSNSTYGGTYEGDISINNPSTDTDYHSYNGNTYSVDWTTEAGMVYGGTLDLTTGVLTVNTGLIASYNGETIGEPWMSDRDRYVAGTTPTIGAQVVYTKASETYQVDRTEVDAYFLNNTIWSDSGDVAISYLVDAKTYIDNH